MRHSNRNFQNTVLQHVNPVVRFMILSDTVFMGASGLLGPIFAIFIENFIIGGNAAVAGMAAGIYLFTKSILQIPIAHLIDRVRGEKDDFWLMFIFTSLIAITPLFYLFINTPLQLYIVQFFLGIFAAFTFPTYAAIFTRHIDREKEGTEWGLYYTLTDLVGAGFAAIGGYIATILGYHTLIVIVAVISLIGALFLLPIKPYLNFLRKTGRRHHTTK